MSLKKFFTDLVKGVIPERDSHVTEWTCVTEKLPKEYEKCEVIVYEVNRGTLWRKGVEVATYRGDKEWNTSYSYEVVVFWRSLPSLPEE